MPNYQPQAAEDPAPPGRVRRAIIIGAGIGAGHNYAARELTSQLRDRGINACWRDILDSLPWPIRFFLRMAYAPVVNYLPSLFGLIITASESHPLLLRLFQYVSKLSQHTVHLWTADADIVIATHALATHALGSLKAAGYLRVPVISYLCDAGVHGLLFHDAVSANLVTTALTKAECERLGHSANVVKPLTRRVFAYTTPECRRRQLLKDLGIEENIRVVLVSSGSLGIGQISQSVHDIRNEMASVVIIVLCGRNLRLQRQLSQIPNTLPLGWRDDIPDLLAISDVMVHNAGGMAVWEAVVAGMPVMTYRPLPGHGMANARVLELTEISSWPKDRKSMGVVLQELLQEGRRSNWREARDDAADWITRLLY